MKKCMVCITDQPNEAPTCALCGEASWGLSHEVTDEGAVSDTLPTGEEPTDADVTTTDTSTQAKRGKGKR